MVPRDGTRPESFEDGSRHQIFQIPQGTNVAMARLCTVTPGMAPVPESQASQSFVDSARVIPSLRKAGCKFLEYRMQHLDCYNREA